MTNGKWMMVGLLVVPLYQPRRASDPPVVSLAAVPVLSQNGIGGGNANAGPGNLVAAGAPAASQPSAQDLKDYGLYATMVAQCKLTDEQKAKVKEKVAAFQTAMKEAQEKNKTLTAELKDAADDKDKLAKVQEKIRESQKATGKVYADSNEAIMTILTEEQRLAWETSQLQNGISFQYAKVKFTDEQNAKIKDILAEAAKAKIALKDKTDYKAIGEVYGKMYKQVEALLTEEQKAQKANAASQPVLRPIDANTRQRDKNVP